MTDALTFASTTPHFALPLLYAGQSQKEVTVNEALVLADLLLQPVVQGTITTAPASPAAGQCWIVGSGATGIFAGHDGALAAWTDGGWRFIAAQNGMRVYDIAHASLRTFNGSWSLPVAPVAPTGGTVIDTQARAALANLVAILRDSSILAAS